MECGLLEKGVESPMKSSFWQNCQKKIMRRRSCHVLSYRRHILHLQRHVRIDLIFKREQRSAALLHFCFRRSIDLSQIDEITVFVVNILLYGLFTLIKYFKVSNYINT